MDEHASLVAAIVANPRDDLPRLVYADWLDEHDEGPRAEFIRVQIAIEERGRESLQAVVAKLLDRERELWKEQAYGPRPDGFLACLYTDYFGYLSLHRNALYRRGFVTKLCGPLAAFWGEWGCGRCEGRRYVPHPDPMMWQDMPCPLCSATGRVSGSTPAMVKLVREHPVERIEVTDKSPFRYDGSELRVWYRESGDPRRVHAEQARLPDALFDALVGWCEGGFREGRWKTFDGTEAARAALSGALLAETRPHLVF